MVFYIGETVDIIPSDILEKRNDEKSWVYGYDPEYDVVIISRSGTLGTIYNVRGLNIGLPAVPNDQSQIINSKVKDPEDQVWVRSTMPEGLNVETQYEQRFYKFIEREWERRENGVFIKIKGLDVYLTGLAYFLYNWFPLDEGYANFRAIQNDLMIYWEACKADPRCYGIDYVKNRRFGWSSVCNAELTESGTRAVNSLCGLMSKTGDDARSMFSRLVRGFKKLPCFFTPIWDGTTTPKKELLLSEPTRRKAVSTKQVKGGNGLDSVIKWFNTTSNSMDGERVLRSALDESGKFPKDVPFDKYWTIVKTSHRIGARIVGKSMVGSTVNAMSKGGLEFKNVFYQSDPTQRSKNGQTQSGLYNLFISAEYCLEGFFDKWGFSIVDDPAKPVPNEFDEYKSIGANTFLDNELEMLEGKPEEYNEFLRQFPRKEEHAFRDDAGDCSFDLVKIYEQLDHNDYELPEHTIQQGNFHWKNGIQDSEVIWSPDPDGRFMITWHPSDDYRNKVEWTTSHGHRAMSPIAKHIGAFGCDPYNRSQTVKKEGSKGSIHLYLKYNHTGAPCNEFVLEYIARPRKVEFFFEDMIKVMRYYSMPVLIELSNENMLRYIKERGYRHFVMNRPSYKWADLSPTEKEFGGIPAQSVKVADAQFYAVEAYINDFVGVATNSNHRALGSTGRMPFSRTLECWKDVDPENRQKYDAYISSSLALLANQKLKERSKPQSAKRALIVNTYAQTGMVSQLIK